MHIIPHTEEMDAIEAELANALVAMVGGMRHVVSME
jgi:hypothetical protein